MKIEAKNRLITAAPNAQAQVKELHDLLVKATGAAEQLAHLGGDLAEYMESVLKNLNYSLNATKKAHDHAGLLSKPKGPAPSSMKPIVVTMGSPKYPMKVKKIVPMKGGKDAEGFDFMVPGFAWPNGSHGDHTLTFDGEVFSVDSRPSTFIKSGEKCVTYKTDPDTTRFIVGEDGRAMRD